jgi:hypothetical protein
VAQLLPSGFPVQLMHKGDTMKALLSGIAAAAALTFAFSANATTVATISGCYDCGVSDTPSLIFNNTTGGTLTNSTMVLTGYQADNLGVTTTVNLGTLGAGSTQFFWGSLPGANSSTTPFNLTAYDYDDEFVGTSYVIPSTNCGGTCAPGGGPQWYADTGNFSVTFTATVSGGTYNGAAVFSVFSPTTNATGGFVGWEGLDPNGYSESPLYDVHTGVVTGDLANIDLGVPPPPVPEPGTLPLFGTFLASLAIFGAIQRRHKMS